MTFGQISIFLTQTNLLGKSTLEQLVTCYNDWAKARNRSQQRDIIFLDLSKAFESVPHERLLLKLQRHGIDGLYYCGLEIS